MNKDELLTHHPLLNGAAGLSFGFHFTHCTAGYSILCLSQMVLLFDLLIGGSSLSAGVCHHEPPALRLPGRSDV